MPTLDDDSSVIQRELEYHESLYSGFAQVHFARPATRAFRSHNVKRILEVSGCTQTSRVLSVGCGIGDTELLLAQHVGEVVGVELSAAGVRQARADAQRLGISNATFLQGTAAIAQGKFDAAIAIFFLHHLSDIALAKIGSELAAVLRPGGKFYSLDPSSRRLSGMVGRLLIPQLMKKYQTPDERELEPESTLRYFDPSEWRNAQVSTYDFGSTPMAGLLPGSALAYRLSRRIDDALLHVPLFRRYGSNFEIVAERL